MTFYMTFYSAFFMTFYQAFFMFFYQAFSLIFLLIFRSSHLVSFLLIFQRIDLSIDLSTSKLSTDLLIESSTDLFTT